MVPCSWHDLGSSSILDASVSKGNDGVQCIITCSRLERRSRRMRRQDEVAAEETLQID